MRKQVYKFLSILLLTAIFLQINSSVFLVFAQEETPIVEIEEIQPIQEESEEQNEEEILAEQPEETLLDEEIADEQFEEPNTEPEISMDEFEFEPMLMFAPPPVILTSQVTLSNDFFGPNTFNATTINGTAESDSQVILVELSIMRLSDGNFWNGSSWQSDACVVIANGTTTWTYDATSMSLDDADTYVITPIAYDDMPNVEIGTSSSFTWDNVNPTDPNNGTFGSLTHILSQYSNNQTITVNFDPSTATDVVSGIDGFYYEFNNSPLSIFGFKTKLIEETESSFTSQPLETGIYYAHLATVDNAGNWTSTEHFGPFWIDTTPPTVGTVEVVNDYLSIVVKSEEGFRIRADVSDTESGLNTATCEYSLDGGITWKNDHGISFNTSNGKCRIPIGSEIFTSTDPLDVPQIINGAELQINVRVQDLAGNIGTGTVITRYVDTRGPETQSISFAPDVAGFTNATPTVYANITDASYITQCQFRYKLNSSGTWTSGWLAGTWNQDLWTCTYTFSQPSPLVDGQTYDFSFRGTDAFGLNGGGNMNNETRTIDTTAPVISEVTAIMTPSTNQTPQYTFHSTEAGTITYPGSCSSQDTVAVSGDNTITFDTLADGMYNDCTIQVENALANSSNVLTVSNFTIDTTAPDSQTTLDFAYYGPQTFSRPNTINGIANDTLSDVDSVSIQIQRSSDARFWNWNGTTWAWRVTATDINVVGTTNWTFDSTGMPFLHNVTYTITPTACDTLGNCSVGTSNSFTWDNRVDSLIIDTPTHGQHVSGIIDFKATASDINGISFVRFRRFDNPNERWVTIFEDHDAPYETTWDTTLFPDGEYMLRARAFDGLNNASPLEVSDITVIIDNTAPIITINPLNTTDTTPALSGTIDDPLADIIITVNGNDYIGINNGDGTWTLPDNTIDPPLTRGQVYEVLATATDTAGNIGIDETTNELTISQTRTGGSGGVSYYYEIEPTPTPTPSPQPTVTQEPTPTPVVQKQTPSLYYQSGYSQQPYVTETEENNDLNDEIIIDEIEEDSFDSDLLQDDENDSNDLDQEDESEGRVAGASDTNGLFSRLNPLMMLLIIPIGAGFLLILFFITRKKKTY